MQGHRLSEVQTFGLELLMFAENIYKGDEMGALIRRYHAEQEDEVAPDLVDDDIVGAEDLSGVQWQSPSDSEEVMADLEMFNAVMAANANVVVEGDEGGEWL